MLVGAFYQLRQGLKMHNVHMNTGDLWLTLSS
jgi:hypothetical protein